MKFNVTFKSGPTVIAEITGITRDPLLLSVYDIQEQVILTEQHLERITGLRVHINQVYEEKDNGGE